MIRPALAFFVACLLSACGGETQQDTPPPSPALWQISGEEGQSGYLFGTIHILPDGVEWQTKPIADALDNSDTLAVEIASFDVADVFATRAQTVGLGPLTERLKPAQRPDMLKLLDHAGHKPGDFADVESWAASIMLANSISNGSSENGVDKALIDQANRADGLALFELEGPAAQLDLFDNLPAEAQRTMLASVVTEFATPQDEGAQRRDAWITGDMERIEQELSSGMMQDPAVYEMILKGRNVAMQKRIVALLNNGKRVFVAVGAGHMVGADGLPALLSNAGYTVQRVQ